MLFRVFFMIIKIIDQKPAGAVGNQRIHADHIRCVIRYAAKMIENICFRQLFIFLLRADYATHFLPVRFGAGLLPEIVALGKITRLSGFLLLISLRIYILPAPESGVKLVGHGICNLFRMNNSRTLIRIVCRGLFRLFQRFYRLRIGNAGTIQEVFQHLIFQLQFV